MCPECAPKIATQLDYELTSIKANDQNSPERKARQNKGSIFGRKMTFQNSKSDLHRSNWILMSCEPLLQISARSDHGQSRIGPLIKSGHDGKNLRFSLFSSFSLMTVRNSKSNLHYSYWRYMSHGPLLQISTRSDHRWSRIDSLMKSRQWDVFFFSLLYFLCFSFPLSLFVFVYLFIFIVIDLGPKNMGPTSSHTRKPNIKFNWSLIENENNFVITNKLKICIVFRKT